MNRFIICTVAALTIVTVRTGAADPPLGATTPRADDYRVWPSQPPRDCPFEASKELAGIAFAGIASDYRGLADTWYPSWASDDNLYSPYADGNCPRADGKIDHSECSGYRGDGKTLRKAATGQAVLSGDDPTQLRIESLGLWAADPYPYGGRYPCGSLVYNGVWYYGTYLLAPRGMTVDGDGKKWNWPVLGPTPGFRISTDLGKTWKETPHSPEKPLFPEPFKPLGAVKIGAPHFVDFGKNMEHSPDGKAYLLCMGAEDNDPKPRMANLSWISGDQIYLIRVKPSVETINDASQYEFFAGHDQAGTPIWTRDFGKIRPLLDWNNNMGCVTATYDPGLKKYLMCVTDGWPTYGKMSSYVLEAERLTGPWRMVVYMKDFGEQAYFLNFPSKFIEKGGRTLWLCYSANFADWNHLAIREHPPGSHYGLVLQKVRLLTPAETARYPLILRADAAKPAFAAAPSRIVAVLDVKSFDLSEAKLAELKGAGGGKAVVFTGPKSNAVGSVQHPPGEYRLALYVLAMDDDHDATALRINGEAEHRLWPASKNKLVACEEVVPFRVTKEGRQTIELSTAETGVFLDRIEIHRVGP